MIIYLVIMLFWLVGIHGNNMLSAVKEALFTPLALENVEAFNKGETPKISSICISYKCVVNLVVQVLLSV